MPRDIRDEAARWVADRDSGLLGADDEAVLARWLAADPRHQDAYNRASRLWSDLDGITETPGMRSSGSPTPARSRRRPQRPAGAPKVRRKLLPTAAAACAALGLVFVTDLPMRLRADAITATGEQRLVRLPDGSSVRLNTDTAVAFDYRPAVRRVRLLRGEAAFSVSADPARPFIVEAAGGTARALGTRFIVRERDDGASVTVTQHRVLVAFEGRQREVKEGERLAYGPAQGIGREGPVEIADAEAWTRDRLVVVNRPLAEVVAELGRYHSGLIYVRPSAANVRVSGNFHTDRPLDALEQIQRAVGVRSVHMTNRLIFLY